jgi:hypothetical protein
MAMGWPRRLCPFAVKKRIEPVQNATHASSVRQPQYEGRETLPQPFDATEEWFFDERRVVSPLTETGGPPASGYPRRGALAVAGRLRVSSTGPKRDVMAIALNALQRGSWRRKQPATCVASPLGPEEPPGRKPVTPETNFTSTYRQCQTVISRFVNAERAG